MMNKRIQLFFYLLCDLLSAATAWCFLFVFRKIQIEQFPIQAYKDLLSDTNFIKGICLIPLFWIGLYFIQGAYTNVLRKARLKEFGETLFATLIGVLILFFLFMLDDNINNYHNYYSAFAFFFCTHFILTYIPRLLITSKTSRKIQSRKIGFPTLIIGSKSNAWEITQSIQQSRISTGHKLIGFITVNGSINKELEEQIPNLGSFVDLTNIIEKNKVEEVIIAIEEYEREKILGILTSLKYTHVYINITADLKDLLLGHVKLSSIFYVPLIRVQLGLLHPWQVFFKRFFDILLSLFALLILSPVFLFVAICIKMTSKGPVFYTQERIGLYGKPFYMHKFRTMYTDAEKNGPMLSRVNDPRITRIGHFLRKVRLDEIPQFYNVLKGTMSLVGPRPERHFFIEQIIQKAPEYQLLHKIKPGITSWGQVQYGYAENVDEMIERLRFDLLYLENMSITLDIKILLHTFVIILQGRGK